MRSAVKALPLLAVLGFIPFSAAASPAKPQSAELRAAFAAAYPTPKSRTHTLSRPDIHGEPGLIAQLQLRPATLTDLGAGRFALVVTETDEAGGCHACAGAVAVAYLHRSPKGFVVDKRWNEVAWIGSSGRPGHASIRTDLAATPIALVADEYVGQGEFEYTGWLMALTADGPRALGTVPLGGNLGADGCEDCDLYALSAQLLRPTTAKGVVSVSYKGWVSSPPHKLRRPLAGVTDYVQQGADLKPVTVLKLPGL